MMLLFTANFCFLSADKVTGSDLKVISVYQFELKRVKK